MKIKVEKDVEPWNTPDFVVEGVIEGAGDGSIALRNVNTADLQELCRIFCTEIFEKAEKGVSSIDITLTMFEEDNNAT